MSVKLIAFDLDNTLASPNKGISKRNALELRNIAREGIHIAILSGKPSLYLLGVTRQLGIDNVIVSGENGADIYFGNALPPKSVISHKITEAEQKDLDLIKEGLDDLGYEYFYQPNAFSITPFYTQKDKNADSALYDFAKYIRHKVNHVDVYFHDDCIDFTPKGINKGKALESIIEELNKNQKDNIKKKEVYVVGDSSNDVPMFKLGFNNAYIRSSFPDIKGKSYKYLNWVLEEIMKGEQE